MVGFVGTVFGLLLVIFDICVKITVLDLVLKKWAEWFVKWKEKKRGGM